MEMDLTNVIEKIKQEGVQEAEKKASDIIKEAEAKAKKTIESAERQKQEILKKAREDTDKLRTTGESALQQAARDVVIALRTQIITLLDLVIKKEVSAALSPSVLEEIIVKLITQSMKKGEFDLEILLNEQDKENLRSVLEKSLQKELKKGVTLKASPAIQRGFRIGEKNKNLYYDFTDEAIAETLNLYLNKKVKEIIHLGLKDAK